MNQINSKDIQKVINSLTSKYLGKNVYLVPERISTDLLFRFENLGVYPKRLYHVLAVYTELESEEISLLPHPQDWFKSSDNSSVLTMRADALKDVLTLQANPKNVSAYARYFNLHR
jgi:hypothetical protein